MINGAVELIEMNPDLHAGDLEGHEGEGRIVATYRTNKVTVHINNSHFRGKTREECDRDISAGGKLSRGGMFRVVRERVE